MAAPIFSLRFSRSFWALLVLALLSFSGLALYPVLHQEPLSTRQYARLKFLLAP